MDFISEGELGPILENSTGHLEFRRIKHKQELGSWHKKNKIPLNVNEASIFF